MFLLDPIFEEAMLFLLRKMIANFVSASSDPSFAFLGDEKCAIDTNCG